MKKFIKIVNGVNTSPMWRNSTKESKYKVVQHMLFLLFEYGDKFKINHIHEVCG